ncbi:hypothetical protein DPMN_120008 [Dreissena polymorpha]|uniref:Uncharacterized protein n=1 Tax=Dreissena polymorpha TaxID=45954 RepID=A0A9D4GMP8_DREPO|nr:hypothetical protein DPMN_120008 [Dreissena polymorpha]
MGGTSSEFQDVTTRFYERAGTWDGGHKDTKRRLQAFEHKCKRRLLRISYTDRYTNKYVRNMTAALIGPQEPLATIKRRKLT